MVVEITANAKCGDFDVDETDDDQKEDEAKEEYYDLEVGYSKVVVYSG